MPYHILLFVATLLALLGTADAAPRPTTPRGELTAEEAAHEALVMGLRLAEGIDPPALSERFAGQPIICDSAVDRMVGHGLVEFEESRLRTTPAGRLLLDSILAEIAA